MAQVNLAAERRVALGKEQVRKLRQQGKVPGIVYGRHMETTIPIQMGERDLFYLTHGSHAGSLESIVINLEVNEGGQVHNQPALIKEIQLDSLKGTVVHLDFNAISLTEKITTHIPVVPTGECKGEKLGGILEQAIRGVEVSCLPTDMPESITIDISELLPHQSIKVGDLNLGDKVEILTDKNQPIFTVIVPRIVAAEEAEAAAATEAAEPEVIGEKKAADEGKEEKK